MKINLGTNICFAKKRWTQPDEWADIVKNELKLDLIEFDSDFLDPLYNKNNGKIIAKEIKKITDKNQIKIHNYFSGNMTHNVNFLTHPDLRLRNNYYNWCLAGIDIACILGAGGIGSNFNTMPYSTLMDKKKYIAALKSLFKALQLLSSYSKEKGLKFLLWEQMYSYCEVPYTIIQSKKFINNINKASKIPIKLVIDLGHMCSQNFKHTRYDTDPYSWIKKLGKYTEVIHLQQTDNINSQHWPFTEEYNIKGIITPKKVLNYLLNSGVEEINLIFEIFFSINVNEEKILKDMKYSIEYWKNSISEFKKKL